MPVLNPRHVGTLKCPISSALQSSSLLNDSQRQRSQNHQVFLYHSEKQHLRDDVHRPRQDWRLTDTSNDRLEQCRRHHRTTAMRLILDTLQPLHSTTSRPEWRKQTRRLTIVLHQPHGRHHRLVKEVEAAEGARPGRHHLNHLVTDLVAARAKWSQDETSMAISMLLEFVSLQWKEASASGSSSR